MAFIARILGVLPEDAWYDQGRTEDLARVFAAQVRAGQASVGNVTWAYLDSMTRLSGGTPTATPKAVPVNPRGVPSEEVWLRPFAEYRRARSEGRTHEQARGLALKRAELVADDDMMLAFREAVRGHAEVTPGVIGYRRVVHPELSKTGRTCGLCLVASDRIYDKKTLLPIHTGCNCTVAEVTRDEDPGSSLNNLSLADLYELAGGVEAGKLIATKFTVREHGELGPVLTKSGNAFRGPDDVAA